MPPGRLFGASVPGTGHSPVDDPLVLVKGKILEIERLVDPALADAEVWVLPPRGGSSACGIAGLAARLPLGRLQILRSRLLTVLRRPVQTAISRRTPASPT